MPWWKTLLGWLWKNRREIARDAETIVEDFSEPTEPAAPLPMKAVLRQQAQAASAAHAFPSPPPLPSPTPPPPKKIGPV